MKLDKSYKVRVTPEQSRKIQELVFALGGGWFGCSEQFIVQSTERPCLYVGNDGRIHANHSEEYFDCVCYSDFTEIQADDLIALLTNLSKSDTEIDTVENTNDLRSEFEALDKSKFKVGDPVYLPNQAGGKILKIQDNKACHYPFFVDVVNTVNNSLYELDSNGKTKYGNFTDVAIKATIENHALLTQLYPHIEFEQPPKPLTGSDLCRAMLEKGWKYVPCYTSNESENKATTGGVIRFIKMVSIIDGAFINNHLHHYKYAIPFDPRTGELLTEYVLK